MQQKFQRLVYTLPGPTGLEENKAAVHVILEIHDKNLTALFVMKWQLNSNTLQTRPVRYPVFQNQGTKADTESLIAH